jgi:5-enolpyruvylshikimate-3-phosphate synthase
VRARAESCTGLAGLVASRTRIDSAEAVDASYPGFFQLMAGSKGERRVRDLSKADG